MGTALRTMDPAALHGSLMGLIELRRRHLPATDGIKPVMRTLFTSAPHNAVFKEAFRVHFAQPLLVLLNDFIPRVDAHFGITRTPEELASKVRAFLSLNAGYFMTGMMLDMPDDDTSTIDALFCLMGWPTG
jgi:hypothetical protein